LQVVSQLTVSHLEESTATEVESVVGVVASVPEVHEEIPIAKANNSNRFFIFKFICNSVIVCKLY
jgi:hypothetical protein